MENFKHWPGGKDFNQAPSEYKSRASPLNQSACANYFNMLMATEVHAKYVENAMPHLSATLNW
jgi:hypothetical protein